MWALPTGYLRVKEESKRFTHHSPKVCYKFVTFCAGRRKLPEAGARPQRKQCRIAQDER